VLVGTGAPSYRRFRHPAEILGHANGLRRCRPHPGNKRHLDDVFVMINGRSWWRSAGSRRTSTPLSLTRRAGLLPDSSFQMICS
jgi:hypothetical protein